MNEDNNKNELNSENSVSHNPTELMPTTVMINTNNYSITNREDIKVENNNSNQQDIDIEQFLKEQRIKKIGAIHSFVMMLISVCILAYFFIFNKESFNKEGSGGIGWFIFFLALPVLVVCLLSAVNSGTRALKGNSIDGIYKYLAIISVFLSTIPFIIFVVWIILEFFSSLITM